MELANARPKWFLNSLTIRTASIQNPLKDFQRPIEMRNTSLDLRLSQLDDKAQLYLRRGLATRHVHQRHQLHCWRSWLLYLSRCGAEVQLLANLNKGLKHHTRPPRGTKEIHLLVSEVSCSGRNLGGIHQPIHLTTRGSNAAGLT